MNHRVKRLGAVVVHDFSPSKKLNGSRSSNSSIFNRPRHLLADLYAAVALIVVGLNGLAHGEEICMNKREAEDGEVFSDQTGIEHSVIVKIKLSNEEAGTQDELETGFALEDRLMSYFDQHPELGEFDGDGVGFGYFDLYMYTTNPDNLVGQILPLVRDTDLPDGSYILTHVTETGADEKRYEL